MQIEISRFFFLSSRFELVNEPIRRNQKIQRLSIKVLLNNAMCLPKKANDA